MKKEKAQFDFIKNEHEILKLWDKIQIFPKMADKNRDSKKRYRFLDGPITANGSMGMHHGWGRSLKDIYIKYKTLQGYSGQYQNGFDAQGMWVEVEVEKLLGLNDKQAILKYGLGKFVEKCMERVQYFADMQTRQSIRLGQIMDWDNSYFTNSDLNITSIWHFLKKCHERDMLVRSYKAMPWCPRCGTSLSEHEMVGSYRELTHKAVFVKLPIKDYKVRINGKDTGAKILVWTTTPWTLSSNVAVAVNPVQTYLQVQVKSDSDIIIVGKEALKVLKNDVIKVVDEIKGSELLGLIYQPALALKVQNFEHKIVPWDMVSATDGSGAVHIAPGCGAEDFELGESLGLEKIIPIDDAGKFTAEFEYLAGLSTRESETVVFENLKKNGTFYYSHDFTHNYPYCWRCKTDVVFKLVSGWDIKTTDIKPELIAAVDTIEWEPEFIKKSMLNWLENMGDWNISRRRFYGLPLPIYPCACGETTVVGSLEELKALSGSKEVESLPHLHRPYIDKIKIKCPKCGKAVERIPEVGDCWLDAGITPFSTKKYFSDKIYFNNNFPSDVVLEMKEQIRLWFYSMLFMSVVLEGRAPYKKVVSYGTMLDEEGKKFSKTGPKNIIFDDAAESFGADVMRYVFASANPAGDMRFGNSMTEEARRKLIAFWNSYVFFNTYAVIDSPDIAGHKPKDLDITDIWLLERLNAYIEECMREYDAFKVQNVIAATEDFINSLSNFYIRVNRRRFWKGENGTDKMNAYWSLYNAIKAVTLILAPVTPFISEYIWQNCVREIESKAPESVMLGQFPAKLIYKGAIIDGIIEKVDFVKDVISVAMKIRAANNLKVKQPLRTMYIKSDKEWDLSLFIPLLKEEVNVKNIEIVQDESKFNVPYLAVDFKKAGAVLKGGVQELKNKLEKLSLDEMRQCVNLYERNRKILGLQPELFIKKLNKKNGFAAETEGQMTVVLDTALDAELTNEGTLRELIRSVQVARQDTDLDITARVVFEISGADPDLKELITKNKKKICDEVLATDIILGASDSGEVKIEIRR